MLGRNHSRHWLDGKSLIGFIDLHIHIGRLLFPLPLLVCILTELWSKGKRPAVLLAGIGGIRACGCALGSIPPGLASASSHSALVSLGLYTVNTPSLMS